jgi:hypothetical protein
MEEKRAAATGCLKAWYFGTELEAFRERWFPNLVATPIQIFL